MFIRHQDHLLLWFVFASNFSIFTKLILITSYMEEAYATTSGKKPPYEKAFDHQVSFSSKKSTSSIFRNTISYLKVKKYTEKWNFAHPKPFSLLHLLHRVLACSSGWWVSLLITMG